MSIWPIEITTNSIGVTLTFFSLTMHSIHLSFQSLHSKTYPTLSVEKEEIEFSKSLPIVPDEVENEICSYVSGSFI